MTHHFPRFGQGRPSETETGKLFPACSYVLIQQDLLFRIQGVQGWGFGGLVRLATAPLARRLRGGLPPVVGPAAMESLAVTFHPRSRGRVDLAGLPQPPFQLRGAGALDPGAVAAHRLVYIDEPPLAEPGVDRLPGPRGQPLS